jgi:hypothetical protein
MLMRPGSRPTRLGTVALTLVASTVLVLSPPAPHAAAVSPVSRLVMWLQRLPRQAVIDGHCQLVDANGVPLTDSLFWQRTGHDPC